MFVMDRLNWPRSSGGDVHGSQMMRALAARGHRITLATFHRITSEAIAGLGLANVVDLAAIPPADPTALRPATRLQQRFERYWGTDPARQLAVASVTQSADYDAVVILGADALPLFRGVRTGLRIWYAADDAALHHWSRLNVTDQNSWIHGRHAAVHALYEWAFAGIVDRVWVVSNVDRRAMRWFTGGVPVDLVPNGVDAEYFHPMPQKTEEIPCSCVFWGRLDFGPNEEALRWFIEKIWKPLNFADSQFDVFGFRPTPEIVTLCRVPGVNLIPDLPDLREEIGRRQVVVLPFISGRGIKNKLLEAAALGRPILATRQALIGAKGRVPVRVVVRPGDWASELDRLFRDDALRADLGRRAREWVLAHHSWDAAARAAEAGVFDGMTR